MFEADEYEKIITKTRPNAKERGISEGDRYGNQQIHYRALHCWNNMEYSAVTAILSERAINTHAMHTRTLLEAPMFCGVWELSVQYCMHSLFSCHS